ncbi:MAG: sulfite exporter TauE/SafE family protein, partial [Gammaproteobacteria bacterium]
MLWALALPGALVIGFSMGLFGSGGSILTVPILVYLLGWEEKIDIASSLAIVGLVALITSLRNLREGTIDWAAVLWFGLPGVLGTYLGAYVSQFFPGWVQMAVFAVV